ncbi:MAG TPA: DNA gyrase inhibitor YacG [Phenylobacterium sp.]|uniref:DNA gyrase inhibitor YacG n=1 Tax=Phenylobacterium sp. TaxID=1871053 RepID=UPI002D38DBB3|nr:DNA gyrase inhibitor YacG [Phenylobacterium sp.]HZZ67380.1 DNA gyrase inhibitor YacG [Phenylobacterium sp.]
MPARPPGRGAVGVTAAKCPICQRPTVPEFRPFCSGRCADVDLHRWLTGHYAVPGDEDAEGRAEPGDDD